MHEILTENDIKFVEEVAKTGNGSKSAKKAYGITKDNYSKLKAHRQMKKPKIIKAIAEMLPDDLLGEKHLALLNKIDENGEIDVNAVKAGLDMAYKIKSTYAPEKTANVNMNISVDIEQKANEAINRFLKK